MRPAARSASATAPRPGRRSRRWRQPPDRRQGHVSSPLTDDRPVAEHHDVVGHRCGEFRVAGGYQHGCTCPLLGAQNASPPAARCRVQVLRLVGNHQPARQDQHGGQVQSLHLATGQRAGQRAVVVLQAVQSSPHRPRRPATLKAGAANVVARRRRARWSAGDARMPPARMRRNGAHPGVAPGATPGSTEGPPIARPPPSSRAAAGPAPTGRSGPGMPEAPRGR